MLTWPRNADRIQVTHSGSLPRTDRLVAANAARAFADDGMTLVRTAEFDALLAGAVTALVRRQLDAGVTAVGDGEFGKASSEPTDFGAWWSYSFQRLPDDKLILPGVVGHATNVVEHPELVAERIARFASLVGRQRVIAPTDCGLGGRVEQHIAWAKLDSLARGAELASKRLWAG